MKNFMRITKAFAVHAMIFSLIQTSFVLPVSADTKSETSAREILAVAQVAVGTYANFLGEKQKSIAQQIAAQQNMQMMQQLSPSCRKPDGTSCYTVAGKFFPECPLPASMSSMPQNVCSNPTPDPAQIASMITYESISKSWINYFDQMQNEASNAANPFGMKCLQDKRKALDSKLTEMVNRLTTMQDQLNRDKETFKANKKQLLEELAQNNDELMGADGSGKNNLKIKTQDFAKYFSSSCQSVIGEKNLAAGPKLGLLGIMQSLSPTNKKAADFNQNRALIESDIRRDIDKLQKSIADGGLDDYLKSSAAQNLSNPSSIAPVNIARIKQASEFNLAKDRINKELSKIGYEVPTMDKNFSVDFDEFLAGSQDFFKKQYINGCVTGADKSGVAISTDQILASLKQRSTNSEGTARDKYKAALKTILDSDSFIEDKLAQIRALESTYKDITITYQNSNAQRVTETPYDLYMKTLKKCEERFSQNDQLANTGGNNSTNVSQKKKIERGQALLRDLKNLHDNFTSNLANRVLDQALNCAGETKKSGSAECQDGNAFDKNSANFCMASAGLCANEIQGCFAEANKHVEVRKAKMGQLAKKFNDDTALLVESSNRVFASQKTAVMDMIQLVQSRFPGTNFVVPEGMFISMPELKKDAYGIDLANDGNMAFMDDLPKKLDLLKKVFQLQQSTVNKEIDDYITKQGDAMNREKDRWKELAQDCKTNIDASSREIAKMNAENAKAQAKQDGEVANFCRKYSGLKSHPNGACEGIKDLATDLDKVAGRITQNAQAVTIAFKNTCNSYNNESGSMPAVCEGDLSEIKDSVQRESCRKSIQRRDAAYATANGGTGKRARAPKLDALCTNGDKVNSNEEFIAAATKKLSAPNQEKLKEVKTLNDAVAKSEEMEDDYGIDFFSNIKGLVKNDKICESLNAINNAEAAEETDVAAAAKKLKEEKEKLVAENTTAQAALETAQKAKAALATPAAASTGATASATPAAPTEAQKAAEASLTAAQTAADKAKASLAAKEIEINKLAAQSQKEKLKKALAGLVPPAPTKDDAKVAELSNLGEQLDGSCDAQASNNNMPKGLGASLLQNFDAAILGTTK